MSALNSKVSSSHRLRSALACSLAFGALGFCYALATAQVLPASGTDGAVSPRAGRELRFAHPFLQPGIDTQYPGGGDASADPDGFDLGDLALGSNITRNLMALGGVAPYTFTSSNINGTSSPGLFLDPSGVMFGKVNAPFAGTGVSFNANVLDGRDDLRNGFFRLQVVTPTINELRFAHDRLPAGMVGQEYITSIETINGSVTTTTYSVVPGSTRLNGAAISNLEFVGLALFRDGTLAGRPLNSGTIEFTARAVKAGQLALNRAGTATDQNFIITVDPETSTQSVLAVTSATIKGDYFRPEKGSLTVSAQIVTYNRSQSDFAGGLVFVRIGRETYTVTLDNGGQARGRDFRVTINADKGTLKIQIRNVDMTQAFDTTAIPFSGPFTAVLQLELGRTYRASEALEFSAKNRTKNFQLTYKLGKNVTLGGLFQLTNVRAAEFFSGTAFRADATIAHVRGRSGIIFGNSFEARVLIGPNFSQTVPVRNGSNRYGGFGVRSIRIDPPKRRFSIETYPLTSAQTGIVPPSQSGGQPQTFDLGVDIDTNNIFFSGDAIRRIFPFFR